MDGLARLRNVTSIFFLIGGIAAGPALPQDTAAARQTGELETYSFRQPCMGTIFGITLYAEDQLTANRAAKAGFDRIQNLDAKLSDYKPDSELNQVCRVAGSGDPIAISSDLWEVLKFADSLSRETGGAFDVTIGPLVKLWREARTTGLRPDSSALADSGKRVGRDLVQLVADGQRIALKVANMQLDLGGIAKGYALDQAAAAIREKFGITQVLIDGGGDVLAGAAPPGRQHWNVAVRNPDASGASWVVPLVSASLATSGDLHQFVEIDGQRYSHIVDPATGLGLTTRLQVSVIAPSGIEADAVASAVSVLGVEKGMEFARSRPNCQVLMVVLDDAETKILPSDGFPKLKETAR